MPSDTQMQSRGTVGDAACIGQLFEALGLTARNSTWSTPEQCLKEARLLTPEPDFLAALQPHSRSLPPREPALAAHDWNSSSPIKERPYGWLNFNKARGHLCQRNYKVKMYNGVLYAHRPHLTAEHAHLAQDFVYEVLLMVMWLYKDLPDMDLIMHVVDHPVACDLGMPVLQFAVFNDTSPSTGMKLDVDRRQWTCANRSACKPEATCIAEYTQGFTMPHRDAWTYLALSQQQLWHYTFCLHAHYISSLQGSHKLGDCNIPRAPIAFWRGRNTGNRWGWSGQIEDECQARYSEGATRLLGGHLMNKRLSLAVMSARWPWMDVGLSMLQPEAKEDAQDPLHAVLNSMLGKPGLPSVLWNRNHFIINLDGYGPAFRVPGILMSNVVMVKQESILREWFAEHARPGVHYEAVASDLRDVGERTYQLTQEAQHDVHRLERMAAAATQLAVDRMNLLAQLDATAWSLARMKELCTWRVQPPHGAVRLRPEDSASPTEEGWHVVKFARTRKWHASIPSGVMQSMMELLSANFE